MYKPEQFLKYALEYFDIEIQEESIQQVEEVSAVKNPSKMLQAVKLSSDNISNISSIMARGFDSIKFGELMSKTSDKIRKSMEPIASTQGLEEVSAVKNSSEMLQAMTLASDNISNMSSIMAREFDPVKFGELMSKTSDKIRKNMEPIASINLASINLASLNRLDLEQLIANMKLKNVNLNTEQIQKLLQSQNFSQQNDKNPEEKNETLEEDS
ncbi:hypothetical protein [Limnoraphis robusta]|uniref:Uncharacterized protein n=1 Tax=Limnoraphis robusta CCNP1315 TaxID=3110306 RepID=A0ABU5TZH9_9CYAN|nr:hypothetical protein [Limnoraphis robusta]MEA5520071.1 hypothetical protein [Limnoraphis robusta CCNP1315]MEA5546767.1 hypothetical protein [Limnoraphis robusta CCNP1324]